MPVERDFCQRACQQSVRFDPRHHYRLGVVSIVVAVSLASSACSSMPDGVDLRPITSLQFTAGPDFLDRIQRQLGGRAADWSKNGVGYLVYRLPNPDPGTPIIRNVDVYREDSLPKAQEIYAHNRQVFTTSGSGQNWKLYREQDSAADKWFISYQEAHFETNHGVPMGWSTKPDIYVGVLKQNVFIEVTYTAYTSSSNYIQTINKDIGFAADLLSKAAL
jgi:hypothetical protein